MIDQANKPALNSDDMSVTTPEPVVDLANLELPTTRNTVFKKNFNFDARPEKLFAQFAHQPFAIWLDSGTSDHVDANTDIMVFCPELTVITQEDETQIAESAANKSITSKSDPLLILDQLHKAIFSNDCYSQSEVFTGGILGYFAYDLGRRFERLPSKAERDINLPEMAVGLYLSAILYCRKAKQYTFVSLASNAEALCLKLELELELENKLNSSHKKTDKFSLKTPWQSNMAKPAYAEKFAKVQEYLLSGDCYQINLAQRFSAEYEGDEFDAYLKLRKANNAPFSSFIRLPQGAVLSISPERFLQVKNTQVQTKPIKGTRPRSSDKTQDEQNAKALQQATKDRAENLMIVDLLRNDLSKSCDAGSVKVPKLFAIESFPAVHHLVSTVTGQLSKDKSSYHLLRDAFPGGSITGAPKIRAMEIIEELEPQRRSVYCGSIGYISANGNMDTSITIRTLVCEGNQVYCWAGGGLVADSECDSEYQETFDKVAKILPVL